LADVTATSVPQQNLNTQDVACGDIDGNGTVDVLLIDLNRGLQIYLNDGQGRFTVADSNRLPPVLRGPPSQFKGSTARFIDINNAGHLDLYVGPTDQWGQPKDLLLLNDGHGVFTPAPDNALPNR
jgi:hypothetical protein